MSRARTVWSYASITIPSRPLSIFVVSFAPQTSSVGSRAEPRFFRQGWMAVDYLEGEVKSALPDTPELAAMLYHLHQQQRLGWRIALLPLLEHYWQQASEKTYASLAAHLKRLRKAGEPQPIRLAPLHMDVHGEHCAYVRGARLIDWEYAGDGDVALELAAVWTESDAARLTLIREYARVAHIDADALARQVRRWRPWVIMLMAGWFEMRFSSPEINNLLRWQMMPGVSYKRKDKRGECGSSHVGC
jgi:thiamine kinase